MAMMSKHTTDRPLVAILGPFLALVMGALASVAWAAPQVFELPDHGGLSLAVPDGWASDSQTPGRWPQTITFTPQTGVQFKILVTVAQQHDGSLRPDVERAAQGAAPQSVEGVLPLHEINGTDGVGFYFSATDRAPKPGEYKYLTQGALRVGDISLLFTVLTNDGQEAVVQRALDMLRKAVRQPSKAL
jgi:hypothetical protein